jgi:hypothetical protein
MEILPLNQRECTPFVDWFGNLESNQTSNLFNPNSRRIFVLDLPFPQYRPRNTEKTASLITDCAKKVYLSLPFLQNNPVINIVGWNVWGMGHTW